MDRLVQIIGCGSLGEGFGSFHEPREAGRLRCCGRAWPGLGREPGAGPGALEPALCARLAFRRPEGLREALRGANVRWERLECLDAANVLDAGGAGLRGGACRAVAGKAPVELVAPEPTLAYLPAAFPRLHGLRRLSLALSRGSAGCGADKLAAPNCLLAVGTLSGLRELYLKLDHCSLEVAFSCALGSLTRLEKLWLHSTSMEYNEAVSGVLASRLPGDTLRVLGLGGTARQVRAILEALGPDREVTLPELRQLDLSVDPESAGARVGDPGGVWGDVPSSCVWRALQRGAPAVESICLWGALSWYPPVGDAWFAGLAQLVDRGGASGLRLLDLRKNRIREDVVARLRERLRWRLGRGLRLLWDGD